MSSIIDTGRKAIQVEAKMITQLANNLDSNFENAVNEIITSEGKLIVTGMGKSGIVGKKIAATLASTGTPSFYIHPGEAFHGDLGMIEQKDSILAISYSGETDEVLKLIPFLRENNNLIIGMSGNSNSTLAKSSKYHLNVFVEKEACPLNLAPTSSTTATMVMGDALAISLMDKKQFKKENFAMFHPGGALGKRLLLKVSDLIQSGKNNPKVYEDDNLEKVIQELNDKAIGGVNVVNGKNELVGIITDGDVRRAILEIKNEKREFIAQDLMTSKPITVRKETKAYEALKLMEDRKNQISVLPVLDQDGYPVGILRLHDLLKVGF